MSPPNFSRRPTEDIPPMNAPAPTMSLPPLGRLSAHSTIQIKQAFQNLRSLYFPAKPSPAMFKSSNLSIPKRSIKHSIHDTSVPDSGYASAEGEEEDDEDEVATGDSAGSDTETEDQVLRADPLERAFAIKWITGFITRADDWIAASEKEEEAEERSELLDDATALLSFFTGTSDDHDFALTRMFTFPLGLDVVPQGSSRKLIHVEIHDAPLSNDDHTSVGLQSWGSCILLADRFCRDPTTFSLIPPSQGRSLRILELGAGTGMLSIVAAKILHPFAPEIVATDYHPDVLENLAKNVATNFPTSPTSIMVTALDWEHPKYSAPLAQPFDIILAADVIYHPSHAEWIKPCIENLLSRPLSAEDKGGVFWLIIAVRTSGRHEGTDETVEALFPNVASITSLAGSSTKPQLAVLHCEVIERRASVGRVDESAYKLFKIGWVN
ncbi:hypothetical protein M413DRAFT_447896 [Hebeloma cylindrosporum]|uniref:Methyltransferase domain-containing protein n=1 Tax=Hebeloma cylindrosporum TaxID=76867 RepID=A0A0C3C3H9_HEBCY|nr:hypothetical protein M413DRAFT_447896 [Hebeloma cylindrosporum h7]